MAFKILAVGAFALLLTATQISHAAPTITTFSLPGAGAVWSINASGTVVGSFDDDRGGHYAFIRALDGTMNTFGVPGATFTFGYSIDNDGTVVGNYGGPQERNHVYVRAPDGTITTVKPWLQLSAAAQNNKGFITGSQTYLSGTPKAENVQGFITLANGGLAKFLYGGWTQPTGINDSRTVVGGYTDNAGVGHSFIRWLNGTWASVDPPGTTQSRLICINNRGVAAGEYTAGSSLGAFVRAADGTISTFSIVGALQTVPAAINGAGWITGFFEDQNQISHGFVRSPGGVISRFDVNTYTNPTGINASGMITGYAFRQNGRPIGFVRSAP